MSLLKVENLVTKYGEIPSRYNELGYTSASLVGAVAEALKGEVEDIPRVAREIKKVATQIETPAGPLAFDQLRYPLVTRGSQRA
jgi:hypothetical protein